MGCCASSKLIKKSNSLPIYQTPSKKTQKVVSTLITPKTRSTTINEISKARRTSHVKHREGPIDDHFEILDKIGSGGYGNVFKAIDKITRFKRALKCIKKNKLKDVNLMKEVDHLQQLVIYI